jgi:large subunit ribosomal protein L4e
MFQLNLQRLSGFRSIPSRVLERGVEWLGKVTSKVFDLQGKPVDKVKLPKVFGTALRPDVIKRAVVAIQSHRFQPQGRDPMAGKRTTAESRGVGLGIARVPRLKSGNRAAFGVGIVGGHRAHPPRSEKKIRKKIPRKEMCLALQSAIAATGNRTIVTGRGHLIDDVPDLPLVVVDNVMDLQKTKDVEGFLLSLGAWADVFRVKESRHVRAGKGKWRGRRYKQARGPLIVVPRESPLVKAARNLPGVDVTLVDNLNVEDLAPGTHPGRFTIWCNSVLDRLSERLGEAA